MYYFIVNPAAASGKGAKVWQEVEQILKKEKIEYERPVFSNADEMIAFVRELTKKSCHIVVLGGDGTLNDVLQGINDFSATTISCIRMGSGNDFARDMKLTKNVKKGLHDILYENREKVIDYGEIIYEENGKNVKRRFLISSGIGYDADITYEVGISGLKKKLNRIHLGKLVYLLIGLKQLFFRECTKATVTLYKDEKSNKENASGEKRVKKKVIPIDSMFFTVGMLHVYEGGGVPFCPKADPTDGLLDVCIMTNMPKWERVLVTVFLYMKRHNLFKVVSMHRCNKMVVETEKPQWFHTDGDTYCKVKRIELSCRQGLRFKY